MSRKLLSLFVTASLLFAPSISFATDVMTRCYSKTISALDSYTKLLIHGDSIGDATGKTVTANGDVAVTTAQYKFAELGRSIVFDGTGDYLSLADSDDWNFGADNFTIDFWVNFINLTGSQYPIAQIVDGSHFWLVSKNSDNVLAFRSYNAGNEAYVSTASAVSFNTAQWYHIAIVRNGSSILIFVNGISQATTVTQFPGTLTNFSAVLSVGGAPAGLGYSIIGYLDEVRISKLARWTSDFTPPTAPYEGARTVVNITGLDGDTDEEYELIMRGVGGNEATRLRFNNDSGSNYGEQNLKGTDSTVGAGRGTANTSILLFNYNLGVGNAGLVKATMYTKSGYVRTVLLNDVSNITGTTVSRINIAGSSWSNTADNITTMVIYNDAANGLGVGTNIELYKKSVKQ